MKIRTNNFSSLYRIFECDLRTIKSCFRAITVPDRLYSDDSRVEAAASLSDLHGRRHNYLRISLTERCNLRCKYCMPAEGVPLSSRSSLLSVEELRVIVGALAAAGVDKLRLTGGEPTLRSDLADIIRNAYSSGHYNRYTITICICLNNNVHSNHKYQKDVVHA